MVPSGDRIGVKDGVGWVGVGLGLCGVVKVG